MYINTIKEKVIKRVKEHLKVPFKGFTLFHLDLTKTAENTLLELLNNLVTSGIKAVVVPTSSLILFGESKERINNAREANRLSILIKKEGRTKKVSKSVPKGNNTVLIEVSHLVERFLERKGLRPGVVSSVLESLPNSSVKKDTKFLFLSFQVGGEISQAERYVQALIKELRQTKGALHPIYLYDFLALHVYNPKNSKNEALIFRTNGLSKERIISILTRFLKELKVEEKVAEIDLTRFNQELISKISNLSPNVKKVLFKTLNNLLERDPEKYKDFLEKLYLKLEGDLEKVTPNLIVKTLEFILKDEEKETEEGSKIPAPKISEKITELNKEINLIPRKFEINKQILNKPGLVNLQPDVEIGNALTYKNFDEAYFKETIEIYNRFFQMMYGLKVNIIDIERVRDYDNVNYNELLKINFEIVLENGKKEKAFIYLPDLKDGYAKVGSTTYTLLNQVYTMPIVSPAQHKVLFKSLFSSITIELIVKNKIKFFNSYIQGVKIPTIYLLLASTCSLDKTLKMIGITEYEILRAEEAKKAVDQTQRYPLVGDYYLVLSKRPTDIPAFLLSGFRSMKNFTQKLEITDISELESCNFWKKFFTKYHSFKFAVTLMQAKDTYIDPLTEHLLKQENIPTDYNELIIELITRAYDGRIDFVNDLRTKRIRNVEIFNVLLFKALNKEFTIYKSSTVYTKSGKPSKLKIHSDIVLKALLSGDASSQFIMINQDYNPLAYTVYNTRATYRGLDGPSFISLEQRNLHPTHYCVFDPVDTTEHKSAGDVQQLAVGANLKDKYGRIDLSKNNKKDCHIFSVASSLVPFGTFNSGNRVQMADNQMKQAVPVENSERPFVGTGFEFLIPALTSDQFVLRAEFDGVVEEIGADYVKIRNSSDKKVYKYYLGTRKSLQAISYLEPVVKKGEKIRKGQIVAEDKNFFKNGFYSSGVNAKVAYANIEGYGIEDSIIISESFAKRMTSVHILKDKETSGLLPVGSLFHKIRLEKGPVKSGEVLIEVTPRREKVEEALRYLTEDWETHYHHRDPMTGELVYTLSLICPVDGEIVDVEIITPKEENLKNYPELLKYVKEEQAKAREQYSDVTNPTPEVLRKLNPFVPIDKSQEEDLIFIRYTIRFKDSLKIGDKLHNRHANKGTVGLILPDDEMPRDEKGVPFEIIFNGFGVLGRINPGQLYETWIGKVVKRINDDIKNGKLNDKGIIETYKRFYRALGLKELVSKIEGMKPSEVKEFVEDIRRNGFVLYIPPGKEVNEKAILNLLKEFGMKPREKIYIPKLGRKTEVPVITGYIYVNKLEQRVETKYKSRSTGKYDFKTMQPLGGSAGSGQRTGEFDVWAITPQNSPNLFKEIMTILSDDHENKDKVIEEIILRGEASLSNKKVKSLTSNQLKAYLIGLHTMDLE